MVATYADSGASRGRSRSRASEVMSVPTLSGRSVTSSTARSWRSSVVASRYKAASLRDLATKTLDGTVVLSPHGLSRLSDEEVKARLTAVRGIGPWTADMFLLFQLRRLDVWPAGDFGVRRGYGLVGRFRRRAPRNSRYSATPTGRTGGSSPGTARRGALRRRRRRRRGRPIGSAASLP